MIKTDGHPKGKIHFWSLNFLKFFYPFFLCVWEIWYLDCGSSNMHISGPLKAWSLCSLIFFPQTHKMRPELLSKGPLLNWRKECFTHFSGLLLMINHSVNNLITLFFYSITIFLNNIFFLHLKLIYFDLLLFIITSLYCFPNPEIDKRFLATSINPMG